jgi:DNA-binding response OmpR family regulator
VVVLDLGLPDGPGTRVLDTLHARWPGTAVLVLTGARQRPAGADAFLAKPFDLRELVAAVRGLVRVGAAQAAHA